MTVASAWSFARCASRLRPLSACYNCAAGMVARYAIEAGTRRALERLRRELPPGRWSDDGGEASE